MGNSDLFQIQRIGIFMGIHGKIWRENSWCHGLICQENWVLKRTLLKQQVKSWCYEFGFLFGFAFIWRACFDFISSFYRFKFIAAIYKSAAHVFTVELSFTNVPDGGKGVFICPLLETHSKNPALPALTCRAEMVPVPHTEEKLHHGFSRQNMGGGFFLMYLVKIKFVLFVQ